MMGEKIISKQTEKEKMLAGELYFAMDEELWREHNHAQNILMKFNNSPDENRSEILKELFGKTGENFCVKPNFRCDYGYNIHVGENFFANYDCVILDVCKVTIGDKTVEMSPKHQLYIIDKGWVRAYDLNVNDKLLDVNGKQVSISKIEYKKYDSPIDTYNLTIEGNNNYFVTDIQVLVHNAGSPTV